MSRLSVVKAELIKLAMLFNETLTPAQLEVQLGVLSHWPEYQILEGIAIWLKNPRKYTRYPSPVTQLMIPFMEIEPDSRQEAVLLAGRIYEAVGKFGWPNEKQAQAYIGPVGWRAVQAANGWDFICRNLGVTLSITTFQAQSRDYLQAQLENKDFAERMEVLALPQSQQEQDRNSLKRIGEWLGKIGDDK